MSLQLPSLRCLHSQANNLLPKKAADAHGAHDDMATGSMSRKLASAPDIEDMEGHATATDEASDREDAGKMLAQGSTCAALLCRGEAACEQMNSSLL